MQIYYGLHDKQAPMTDHTAKLVSSGKINARNALTLRMSGRKDVSLFLVKSGAMHFDSHVLTSGDVYIYPTDAPQRYLADADNGATYYYLHFTGNNTGALLKSLNIPLLTPFRAKEHTELCFEKIIEAQDRTDALGDITAEYLILQLLTLLAPAGCVFDASAQIFRVTEVMSHSYDLPYDAKRFADILSVSVSRFNHLFKDTLGVRPQRYYNTLKMDNARILLMDTDMSVKKISEAVGFSDPLYFGQAFKRHFGLSPTAMRAKKD